MRQHPCVTGQSGARDREMLDEVHGEASRSAMSLIVRMAEVVAADEPLPVEQGHIDAGIVRFVLMLSCVRIGHRR